MTLTGSTMGEVDGDVGPQHSPTTRRPSPTSVQQLLDLVHLQQQTTHITKRNDQLLSSRSLAPLPAIGRKSDALQCESPRNTDRKNASLSKTSPLSRRSAAVSKSFPLYVENDDLQEGYLLDSPRQETNASIYRDKPAQKSTMYSMRREGTNYRLPPLSELQKAKEREIKAYEISQERAKAQKRSANIEYYLDDPPPRPVTRAGSRIDRPRTSRGRRKMPSPESMEDYGTQDIHQNGEFVEPRGRGEVSYLNQSSDRDCMRYELGDDITASPRQSKPQRPKSARGRRQPTFIGRDDYESRPRAPSPPSPGLYSDDDELNEELRAINAR